LNPDLKIVFIKDAGTGPELNISWQDIGTGHENFEKHEKRRGHFAKSPSLFRGVGGGGVAKKVERAESAREPF